MPDLDAQDVVQNEGQQPAHARQPREPNGRWTEEQEAANELARARSNAKTADPDEPPVEEEASPVDDEFFEIEIEKDGKPVKERLKASEVWERAQRAQQLEADIAEMRKGVPPPEEFDREMFKTVQVRGQLMQAMQTYAQMLTPREPDESLIDPESRNYDPALYNRQRAFARQQQEALNRIQSDYAQLQAQQNAETAAVDAAYRARERSKLGKIWPEVLTDSREAARVRDELDQYYGQYGWSRAKLESITDSSAYAIIKDALAYRRGQKAKEAAVKVVRSKPKLVRGAARDVGSPATRRSAQGLQRLQQSGSIEDAAAALDGLL